MSKFYVWIDNPSEQIQSSQEFNAENQRIRGFLSGEKISSKVNNTAIRQANLIAVAMMDALGVSDNFDVTSSVIDLTEEIKSKLNLNLISGTGDYSVVQKTAEGEENEATASGTYAGGKKSKTTANRGFTHGNTVENNGNSAASFGQTYTNDGNVALTQMAGGYNGGASAAVVGQNIYNRLNQTADVPNEEGGAAAAVFGAHLFNSGSHAQVMGYLLSNSKPMATRLGRANENKSTTLFEIGYGGQLTVDQTTKTFTYQGVASRPITYTILYQNDKPYQIQFPNDTALPEHERGLVLTIGEDNMVETSGGKPVYIIQVRGTLYVYEAKNIFEIDELGQVIAKGGLFVKKARSLAEMELESDGLRVKGKVQSNGKVSGDSGEFAHGLDVKTRGLAEFRVYDDGAEVKGWLRASNAPVNPTDVVRLQDLPASGGGKTYYRHKIKFTNNTELMMIMFEIIDSSNTAYTLTTLSQNYFDMGSRPITAVYDKLGNRNSCVFNMYSPNSITIQGVYVEGSNIVSINANYNNITNWSFADTVTEL